MTPRVASRRCGSSPHRPTPATWAASAAAGSWNGSTGRGMPVRSAGVAGTASPSTSATSTSPAPSRSATSSRPPPGWSTPAAAACTSSSRFGPGRRAGTTWNPRPSASWSSSRWTTTAARRRSPSCPTATTRTSPRSRPPSGASTYARRSPRRWPSSPTPRRAPRRASSSGSSRRRPTSTGAARSTVASSCAGSTRPRTSSSPSGPATPPTSPCMPVASASTSRCGSGTSSRSRRG